MISFVSRVKKSQNQKKFREAVGGEETRGGKQKKKHKKDGVELLPEVSRADVEQVGVLYSNLSIIYERKVKYKVKKH